MHMHMCMSHVSRRSDHLNVEQWRVGGVDGSHDDRPVWNTGAGSSGDVRHEGRQARAKRRVGQSSVDDLVHPPALRRRRLGGASRARPGGGEARVTTFPPGGINRGTQDNYDKSPTYRSLTPQVRCTCASSSSGRSPARSRPCRVTVEVLKRRACGWSVEHPCMLTYGAWMHHRTLDTYTPTPY